jgi:hypothetical protein
MSDPLYQQVLMTRHWLAAWIGDNRSGWFTFSLEYPQSFPITYAFREATLKHLHLGRPTPPDGAILVSLTPMAGPPPEEPS